MWHLPGQLLKHGRDIDTRRGTGEGILQAGDASSRCRVFLEMHGVSLEMGSVLPEMDSALSEMESVFLICLPLFPNQEMLNSN